MRFWSILFWLASIFWIVAHVLADYHDTPVNMKHHAAQMATMFLVGAVIVDRLRGLRK